MVDDVAFAKNENANLRKIQNKLLQWDMSENPLAPLTALQKDVIYSLSLPPEEPSKDDTKEAGKVEKTAVEAVPGVSFSDSLRELENGEESIDTFRKFLSWYDRVNDEILNEGDSQHWAFLRHLRERRNDCDALLEQIDDTLQSLKQLEDEFQFVSTNTSSLHEASEKLVADQEHLSALDGDIRQRLQYFTQLEQIAQKLQNPTLSVLGDNFAELLVRLDESLEYLEGHRDYRDAGQYMGKCKQCVGRVVQMMRSHVINVLSTATEQVLAPKRIPEGAKPREHTSDTAFALFYGKFQASAPKVKRVTNLIEQRKTRCAEYETLLQDLHEYYLSQRRVVMYPGVGAALQDLTVTHRGDHCALVRAACAFLVHVCQDEYRLFLQFFPSHSREMNGFLDALSLQLYDTIRPFVGQIAHLETLAELSSILRTEMLDEHVHHSPESLGPFGRVINQLLHDVQDRLVVRARHYIQSDILNYKPSAGDLAYPDKLEMMESIALSLQEPPSFLQRADSRASMFSMTSQEVDSINSTAESQMRSRTGNSPADLHGMWYPTVRRTLVCLSRLYRCVDRPIFQNLSQEALTYCIQSVSAAAALIQQRKTNLDGELFEIKHLLILREQIAPFRVDFIVKKTSLDFSKMKTAAYGLIQKRGQLFALGSNNALLEFLLEGTPQMKEQLLDSRKDVDRQLKSVCEIFIRDATNLLVGNILGFMERMTQILATHGTAEVNIPEMAPPKVGEIVQEAQKNIKLKLSGLQRAMQLYLANKDTEFILFRPIRNNIIAAFVKLEQFISTTGKFSKEDLAIAACPSADQISVLLSASVLAEGAVAQGAPPSRKSTLSSVENEKIQEEMLQQPVSDAPEEGPGQESKELQ
ncbi:conserved oligomeric Golgi complex subunit 3 [Lutzomyia longipalpis]|uniref:conserved oligomeric Golgi complex subunit 3 n=1 Tax=Lutzomyia longipalpis TaxID=7200 RepID=UPI0024839D9C|nr:conserved oligomeric Golgi complex subunit 3 [Lutzomyia longipalpis]